MNRKKTIGVYGEYEMGYMTAVHRWKAKVLGPVVKVLDRMGVTANMLSVLGGVIVVGSLILSLYLGEGIFFVIGIWVHIIFDVFDGSLARFQKKESDIGSFFDVGFDFLGVVSASVFLFYFEGLELWILALYTILYAVVLVFAIILGRAGKPYKFPMRPRLFMYGFLTIDFVWNTGSSGIVVGILTILLVFSALEGGFRMGKLKSL